MRRAAMLVPMACLMAVGVRADVLDMGPGLTSLETVPVGNPGNAPDTRYLQPGYGGVDYSYRIGKYEVTVGQYVEFLNAVAATDTYGLYSVNMWSGDYGYMIERSGAPGSYAYTAAPDHTNRPVNHVSFGDACRFANWLHNGQPIGIQDPSTTEDGAYLLGGAVDPWALQAVMRKAGWRWAVTSEDEWCKAAYHKNDGVTGNYYDYPCGSDDPPGRDMDDLSGNNANYWGSPYPIQPPYYKTLVGEFQNSASPYGTFDQGGNVQEWNEGVVGGSGRGLRGGSFLSASYGYLHAANRNINDFPTAESRTIGFRVVRAMVAGDFNGDGVVNAIDLLGLAKAFNTSLGDSGYNAMADFNGDGVVNAIDLLTLARNWQR